jgi:hypothetical protein
MKRGIVLGVLIVVGALSLVVAAQQQGGQPQARVVEVEKLKDNLFVLKGGGGNTAVFVTANGWSWTPRTPAGVSRSSTRSRC